MHNEYDFSDAKRAKDVPHLARLQVEAKNRTVVTLMLDDDVFQELTAKAENEGTDYQALLNRTLREALTIGLRDEVTLI